jgi:hypothetical protein
MKTCFKLILFALTLGGVAAVGAACEKDNGSDRDGQLVVNHNNISGTWQLTRLNGEEPQGIYGYIELTRRAVEDDLGESFGWREFDMYSNLNSAQSRHLTGRFRLTFDDADRAILTGVYDYDQGFWEHDYIVDQLTADTMTWVAEDDPEIVSVYTRCSSIPADVQ